MWMVCRVFKENSFGSATVEIGKDQKVISTGPHALVRNPMYSSAAVHFIGMPLMTRFLDDTLRICRDPDRLRRFLRQAMLQPSHSQMMLFRPVG
jgi:hypothetical protein